MPDGDSFGSPGRFARLDYEAEILAWILDRLPGRRPGRIGPDDHVE
jgi:hypothetical protein